MPCPVSTANPKGITAADKKVNAKRGEKVRHVWWGKLPDYLPVKKVAECIATIAFQKKIQGIMNCCSGKSNSIRKFVEDYLEREKCSIELSVGHYTYPNYCESLAFWGDNRKMRRILAET